MNYHAPRLLDNTKGKNISPLDEPLQFTSQEHTWSEKAHSANQSWMLQRCGFNLNLGVIMLSKFFQVFVHILIEMLLKYNDKQRYIHKVLKKVEVYL